MMGRLMEEYRAAREARDRRAHEAKTGVAP
jgi:hypothetical protein